MSTPSTPVFLKEGPAAACIIDHTLLGWTLCTCLSNGMGLDKSTLNRIQLSGCEIRRETKDPHGHPDTIGGTTLPQMKDVANLHGVPTELHVGSNVCTLWYASYQGALGRGFILQGNTQPDGRGNVNHAVWVNHPRYGTPGDPDSFAVYDPWSNGPAVWSYAKTKAFAMALRPWGENDPRTLRSMGSNGVYCLIFPDTEPHAHLHYGGKRTGPFPDAMTVRSPKKGQRVNVRSRPDRIRPGDIQGTYPTGKAVTMYQVTTTGAKPPGSSSRTWYGNHDGNRWIHESGLTGHGGAS